MIETTTWDSAAYLRDDSDIAAYLSAAIEDGDGETLRLVIGNIARAKGMTQLSKETGITRDGLYKAFSVDGNPSFATVQSVLKSLGLRFDIVSA